MYSDAQASIASSSKRPVSRDRDWIVVDSKIPSKTPPAHMAAQQDQTSWPQPISPALSTDSDDGVLLPTQPIPGLDSLLASINSQRNELANMKKTFLEGQAQIQEERDLFQAQYYALRNQQEEREVKRVDDKQIEWKADLEHLRAESILRQDAKGDYLQRELHRFSGQITKETEARVDGGRQLEDTVASLRLWQEAQASELVNSLENVRVRVAEIAEQVSELRTAVAELKLMHDEHAQALKAGLQAQIDELKHAAFSTATQEQQRPSIPTGPRGSSKEPHTTQSRRVSQPQTSPPRQQRQSRHYSQAGHKSYGHGRGQYDYGIVIAGLGLGLSLAGLTWWWMLNDE